MHDGIHLEKVGIPAITICTDIFEITSRSMAQMWGAEDYPIIYTSHPISHLNASELRIRAEEMLSTIENILLVG